MSDRSDILLTLFNTLTKAFDRNEAATNTLVAQQGDLVNHIKGLNLNEIKQEIKDHEKSSSEDIGTCTEEVQKVEGKVGKMITVVITLSTILSLAVLIASTIVYFGTRNINKQTMTPAALEEILDRKFKEHETEENRKYNELKQEIEKRHEKTGN